MTTTITKEQAEVYDIRGSNGLWALITVTSDRLLLQISSDYGNWGYRWHDVGESFKEFLAGLTQDYLVNKLVGGAREFDAEATLNAVKEHIVDVRRQQVITKDEARAAWDWVVEDAPSSTEAAYDTLFRHPMSAAFCEPEDVYAVVKERLPTDCVHFFKNIYVPHFVPALEAERNTGTTREAA